MKTVVILTGSDSGVWANESTVAQELSRIPVICSSILHSVLGGFCPFPQIRLPPRMEGSSGAKRYEGLNFPISPGDQGTPLILTQSGRWRSGRAGSLTASELWLRFSLDTLWTCIGLYDIVVSMHHTGKYVVLLVVMI